MFGLRRITLVLLCLTLPVLGKLAIKVVSIQQRWPWNGLVDITYTVDCDLKNSDGSPAAVSVRFSGYDRDRDCTVEMKTLSGAGVGKPVTSGGPYQVIWNAGKDYKTFHSSYFQVVVKGRAETRNLAEKPSAPKPSAP